MFHGMDDTYYLVNSSSGTRLLSDIGQPPAQVILVLSSFDAAHQRGGASRK